MPKKNIKFDIRYCIFYNIPSLKKGVDERKSVRIKQTLSDLITEACYIFNIVNLI